MDDRGALIKQGRDAVRAAFRHRTAPGQSPVAYFAGQHRPAQPRRKPGSIRHQVHASGSMAPQFSRPNLMDDQVLTGYIHRWMADLPPLEFLWLQYRYRPQGVARQGHGNHFHREYFRRYEKEHLHGCKSGTRRMVHYLIAVAMDSEATRTRVVVPDSVDITRRNWNKTYRPHWHHIRQGLSTIDTTALLHMGKKVTADNVVA